MTELVLDHYAEESQLRNRHVLFRAHDFIGVGDTTDVLHCAILVVRAHHVIHFCERIAGTKALLVKVQSCLGNSEYQLVTEKLD